MTDYQSRDNLRAERDALKAELVEVCEALDWVEMQVMPEVWPSVLDRYLKQPAKAREILQRERGGV